jgi:hypothetical protein
MSIAGVSSNFSALSTTDVQAEVQYSEDTQLLAQTLQTQSLQSPALWNPALSETANLLNSVQPSTLSSTTNLLENASITTGGALASLDHDLTSAPGQAAGFGIAASDNTTGPASTTGSNNSSGTNNTTSSPPPNSTSNNTQPGALQSLIQEIQEQAQEAYTATQRGSAGANTNTTLATG